MQASINKSTHVGQPVFSVLFALFSLAGDSPPASKRTKIPRKSKAVRCEAVLPEQKCSQTRKRPQRILCVFSRALTRYEGISARQNRVCPCQPTLKKIKASHPTKGTKGMLPRYHPHSELLKNSALMRCNGRGPPGIGRRSRANYTEPFPRGALSRRRPSLLRRYSVIFPINAK